MNSIVHTRAATYRFFLHSCRRRQPPSASSAIHRVLPAPGPSILRRVQSPRPRAEPDVGPHGVVVQRLPAIPQACSAEHAFLAVEGRHSVRPRRERLPGAHLDAQLGAAALAEVGIQEYHVVGIPPGRLHLAAYQQRVLLRHRSWPSYFMFRNSGRIELPSQLTQPGSRLPKRRVASWSAAPFPALPVTRGPQRRPVESSPKQPVGLPVEKREPASDPLLSRCLYQSWPLARANTCRRSLSLSQDVNSRLEIAPSLHVQLISVSVRPLPWRSVDLHRPCAPIRAVVIKVRYYGNSGDAYA